MAQPALNVDYPVQLGPSFQGQGNGSYATMRYDFKPASVKGSAVCRQQGNKVRRQREPSFSPSSTHEQRDGHFNIK